MKLNQHLVPLYFRGFIFWLQMVHQFYLLQILTDLTKSIKVEHESSRILSSVSPETFSTKHYKPALL